jgi:hypothetical protein
MEMAGIVCYTGAGIIKCARELIEQIGGILLKNLGASPFVFSFFFLIIYHNRPPPPPSSTLVPFVFWIHLYTFKEGNADPLLMFSSRPSLSAFKKFGRLFPVSYRIQFHYAD